MHPVRGRKLASVLFLLFGTAVCIALVLYALRQNINSFYLPQQVVSGEAPHDVFIRVGGYVRKGSVRREDQGNSLVVLFDITDRKGHCFTVKFRGLLPDLFAPGEEVMVKGFLMPSGLFQAKEVLAKHDENYRPRELEALNSDSAE